MFGPQFGELRHLSFDRARVGPIASRSDLLASQVPQQVVVPPLQLRGAGCTKIYREKVTGARSDRREHLKRFKALAPGDVVTVTRIDRLGSILEMTRGDQRIVLPQHRLTRK